MAGWLNRLRRTADSSREAPGSWAGLLSRALEPLALKGSHGKQLAADLHDYVLTGDPVSVLANLQNPDVNDALGLRSWAAPSTSTTGPDFYAGLSLVPPGVVLRWATVLANAVTHDRWCTIQLPDGATWPGVLLHHASRHENWYQGTGGGLTLELLDAVQIAAGWDPATVLAAAFMPPVSQQAYADSTGKIISRMPDTGPALARHVDAVRAGFPAQVVAGLDHVPALLAQADDQTLRALATEVARLAVANSKQLRAEAAPLVARLGIEVVPPLQALAVDGRPDQRARALGLIWEQGTAGPELDDALLRWARDTAAADRAGSVRDLITRWEAATQTEPAAAAYEYEVPDVSLAVEVTPGLTQFLESFWDRAGQAIDAENARHESWLRHAQANGHHLGPAKLITRPSAADRADVVTYLRSPAPNPPRRMPDRGWELPISLLSDALTPDVTPAAALKLLVACGASEMSRGVLHHHNAAVPEILRALHERTGGPTLLEFAGLLELFGYPPSQLVDVLCNSYIANPIEGWPDDQVWPFVAHHLPVLESALTRPQAPYNFDQTRLFRLLATLPQPAPSTVSLLFQLALGPAKTGRPAAQAALDRFPDKEARIIAALADSKAENRTVAAQWLGRLRHEPTVPALEAAVRTEKNDVAKGALLDALEQLGRPVETYLDLGTLPAQAATALKKGLPAALSWLDPESLPPVRWAASGDPVPVPVLTWFLVQAVRQKSVEPNAVLRQYCSLFDPAGREQFGQWVLEHWIAADLTPVSADVALATATRNATWEHQYVNQHPAEHPGHRFLGVPLEQAIAMLLPPALRQPAGSANDSKGVLAIAASCAGGGAAPVTGRYLKEWFGQRLAQGKALIVMLAWIDHPAATQLMLSVGSRFRTKGIQDEAVRQAEALAQRRGWSLEELTDRTLPSAGFDENGEQELSYGPRSFTAMLRPGFTVALRAAGGKEISALPAARQDDDPDAVAAAKKTLTATKKELKAAVALQTGRLYEALCTQRTWQFDDWDRYLNRHPVGRYLAQRLVWLQIGNDDGAAGQSAGLPAVLSSFRPLDDGSLSDVEDDEVTLPPGARIVLAHDWLLSPGQVTAWQAHLADYQVVPLFTQLGKAVHQPSGEQLAGTAVTDVRGHVLEAFALRGRATKLGWNRGAAEDGGWFMTYLKRFPGVGLQAEIHFSGNTLPEENRTVALEELGFSRLGDDQRQGAMVRLADVPPVLLSECIGDLRALAAEGPGYRADWETMTQW